MASEAILKKLKMWEALLDGLLVKEEKCGESIYRIRSYVDKYIEALLELPTEAEDNLKEYQSKAVQYLYLLTQYEEKDKFKETKIEMMRDDNSTIFEDTSSVPPSTKVSNSEHDAPQLHVKSCQSVLETEDTEYLREVDAQ